MKNRSNKRNSIKCRIFNPNMEVDAVRNKYKILRSSMKNRIDVIMKYFCMSSDLKVIRIEEKLQVVCRNKLSKRQLGETRVALQNEWNECKEVCSVSQVGSMAGWSGANTKANFVLATVHDSLSNHQQSDNDNSSNCSR